MLKIQKLLNVHHVKRFRALYQNEILVAAEIIRSGDSSMLWMTKSVPAGRKNTFPGPKDFCESVHPLPSITRRMLPLGMPFMENGDSCTCMAMMQQQGQKPFEKRLLMNMYSKLMHEFKKSTEKNAFQLRMKHSKLCFYSTQHTTKVLVVSRHFKRR